MKPSERKAFILEWLKIHANVNALDQTFSDAYIKYTGAPFEAKNWGAHWCKTLSNDLRKMFLAGLLIRNRVGLGGNWQPGFPTWCWMYERKPSYQQEPCCPTCNGPRDSDGSRIHEADCQIAKDEGLVRRDE